MARIDQINEQNFNDSFDLKDLLIDSVFYPASGIDGKNIEYLSDKANSFVHVDYSTQRHIVEEAMRTNFTRVGYRVVGLNHISKRELTPNGFNFRGFQLNDHERERLKMDFIRRNFNHENFEPFALWAVYELDETLTHKMEGKINRFSLLHIGGEACATFEAIYTNNRINPFGVAIINPGEGYGDNWTLFTDPNFRLYKMLLNNSTHNNQQMPKYILTNLGYTDVCFWPNYNQVDTYNNHEGNQYRLFQSQNTN